MAPRTFWSIFLKLLGIYAVLDSVSIIPQIISYLIYYKSSDTSGYLIEALLLLIIIIGIFWLIIRLTVFKTDWLIDKLHLDNNFTEEKIDINNDRHGLLNVAIIIIGGVLFIDSLPLFLKDLYEYFKEGELILNSARILNSVG